MPILYKRMKPETLAYELFDIDKLDAGPRMIKECRQREAERQEAEAQVRQMQRHMEQMQPDYVLGLLNRSTMNAMETSKAVLAADEKPAEKATKKQGKITFEEIAVIISSIAMLVLLAGVMATGIQVA